MAGFAVFDTETSGLSPKVGARIVEIAIVLTDERGRITGKYETLLNPSGPVGATSVHRIRPADVVDAPSFRDIAPKVVELLNGRAVVAHNMPFDKRMLVAEFAAIGYTVPGFPEVCTLQFGRRQHKEMKSHKLHLMTAEYGVRLDDAHRAMADTVATANLLEAYIRAHGHDPLWTQSLDAARKSRWAPMSYKSAPWYRREDVGTSNRTGCPELKPEAAKPIDDRRRRAFWALHGLDHGFAC